MKKLLIHIRSWVKVISLVIIASIIVMAGVAFIYKPTYSVTLNGELIGYTKDKSTLQSRINDYIDNGDGVNIAFVQVDNLPEYSLCLLKKNIETNDEEIFNKVADSGTAYYRYYAILDDDEEKLYVATFEEAEKAVEGLKEKNSKNKDDITIQEKYEIEPKDVVTSEEVISKLYEKAETKKTKTVTSKSGGVFIAASGVNTGKKVSLGISLIRPVSGTVTSRFGTRWGSTHKGIDIGAQKGTPVKAAAGGTVVLSSYGYNGGYGNYVIISHGNGVQTVYGHCTSLNVSVGQKVSQGQIVATVGSTGRSTGNHLHFEIRVNGVAQNPQNYLY
ncbi:MAG: M23 family metallopeptidase [Clostridia bacterium]|nr:M23 family metallopeptidase [Clostridia bacterium]